MLSDEEGEPKGVEASEGETAATATSTRTAAILDPKLHVGCERRGTPSELSRWPA